MPDVIVVIVAALYLASREALLGGPKLAAELPLPASRYGEPLRDPAALIRVLGGEI